MLYTDKHVGQGDKKMKSEEEGFLIGVLIETFEEINKRSDELHPKRVLSLLEGRLSSIIFEFRYFDLLNSLLLIRFLKVLNDRYFDGKIDSGSKDELDNASIPEEVKSMIMREISSLSLDRHFDDDYVLLFKTFKEDMNTLSEVMEVFGEKAYEREIVFAINRATDKILEELKEINSKFFQTILEDLKEKRSIVVLEDSIKGCVREMHTMVFGWPESKREVEI